MLRRPVSPRPGGGRAQEEEGPQDARIEKKGKKLFRPNGRKSFFAGAEERSG